MMDAAVQSDERIGQEIRFTLNGQAVALNVDPRDRLADALRYELGLTGTKVGCNAGDCGACTVLVDGEQLCACLMACGQVAGRAVTTVEGLAADPQGSRLQQAFLDHGAAQCGICTPGMLMAASALLSRVAAPTSRGPRGSAPASPIHAGGPATWTGARSLPSATSIEIWPSAIP